MTDAVAAAETTPITPSVDAAAIAAEVAAALKAGSTPAPEATVETAQTAPEPYVFEETGDAGLDLALEYLGNLGLTDEHPAIVKAAAGDFGPLEAHLKAVKAPGHEKYLKLAREGVARQVTVVNDAVAAKNNAVFAVVGGAENWAKVAAWAKANATDSERDDMNEMLRKSPTTAAAAAKAIFAAFNAKTGGFTQEAKNPVNQHGANGYPAGKPAKTIANRRELAAATDALVRRHGSHNIHLNPEYIRLHAEFNKR